MEKPALSRPNFEFLKDFLGFTELPEDEYFVGLDRLGGKEGYYVYAFPLRKEGKTDGEIIGPEEWAKDNGFQRWFVFKGKSFMTLFYHVKADDHWFDGNKYCLGELLVEFLDDYADAVANHARKSYWRNMIEVRKYQLAALCRSIKTRFR